MVYESLSPKEVLVVQASPKGNLRKSKVIDSFSGWLLLTFGAVFALLINNLDSLKCYLTISQFKIAGYSFVVSTIFAILQKYFATGVASGLASGKATQKLLRRLEAQEPDINKNLSWERIYNALEKAYWLPKRLCIKRINKKNQSGNYFSGILFLNRLLHIQGWALFVQLLFHVITAYLLIKSITF